MRGLHMSLIPLGRHFVTLTEQAVILLLYALLGAFCIALLIWIALEWIAFVKARIVSIILFL